MASGAPREADPATRQIATGLSEAGRRALAEFLATHLSDKALAIMVAGPTRPTLLSTSTTTSPGISRCPACTRPPATRRPHLRRRRRDPRGCRGRGRRLTSSRIWPMPATRRTRRSWTLTKVGRSPDRAARSCSSGTTTDRLPNTTGVHRPGRGASNAANTIDRALAGI